MRSEGDKTCRGDIQDQKNALCKEGQRRSDAVSHQPRPAGGAENQAGESKQDS